MPDLTIPLPRTLRTALIPTLLLAMSLALGGCTSETAPSGCRTVLNCKDEAAPICDANSLACRACVPTVDDLACKNRSASTPRCGSSGRCTGCMSNTDCTSLRTPVCGPTNSCQGCASPADCASRICVADGSCAPTTDVLFVNNKNGACTGTTHTGAMDDPFCGLQEAVTAAHDQNKSLVSVTPSSRPYDAVTVGALSAAGLRLSSSTGVAGSVQVRASSTTAFSVTVTGGPKVVVSGFDFSSSSGNGIDCAIGADLTVLQSRVHHSANGIVASGCKLTIDGVRVYKNDYNGVSLTGNSTYLVNNLMVWSNGASGVSLSSSTGTFRFSTIYANGSVTLNQPPGIDCGAGQNLIENSIVYNNISVPAPTVLDNQLVGCMASNVVTNDSKSSGYGGTFKSTVEFNNASGNDPSIFDLRLKVDSAVNIDCCIDKVQGSSLIDHDVDSIKRPQGVSWDIGAAEGR